MTLVRLNNWMPELSNIMNNYFDRSPLIDNSFTNATQPPVNIYETDGDFQIELAAPGYSKTDFTLEVNNNILTVAAKKENASAEGLVTRKQQFNFESFERSFHLPKNAIDDANINASYVDGILKITLLKKEEVKPKPARMIEVA